MAQSVISALSLAADRCRVLEQEDVPVRLGVLTTEIGPELVDQVIELAGRREQRRRLLPARLVVYFVLALCLFSGADSMGPPGYRSVLRWLTTGLRHLHGLPLPTSSALTKARQRLGWYPLELLFDRLRGPLVGPQTPGSFAFGLRLVAWDGTTVDAADTPANVAAFGIGSQGGHPQLRLMALIECGTHAVIDAVFEAATKFSEHRLARQLACALGPGMLLLADRNFPGYTLWARAVDTGADLLWRVKRHQVFPLVRVLPDGSYLAMFTAAAARTQPTARAGQLVRVIEYTVSVHGAGLTRTEPYRLITTVLDHHRAPAAHLAQLYQQRWETEHSYGELKTRLRGAEFILRSQTPALVRQELFALLAVYQALCALQVEAAHTAGIDPDRISFTVTIRIARDNVCNQAGITPDTLHRSRREAIIDLLADLLPRRRLRRYERVKKPAKNTFPTQRHDQPRPPSHITYKIKVAKPTGQSP